MQTAVSQNDSHRRQYSLAEKTEVPAGLTGMNNTPATNRLA
jgi:hypothetical protein